MKKPSPEGMALCPTLSGLEFFLDEWKKESRIVLETPHFLEPQQGISVTKPKDSFDSQLPFADDQATRSSQALTLVCVRVVESWYDAIAFRESIHDVLLRLSYGPV